MRTLILFDTECPLIEKMTFSFQEEYCLFSLAALSSFEQTLQERMTRKGLIATVLSSAWFINESAQILRERYLRWIAEIPEQIQSDGKNFKELFAIDGQASLWWLSLVAEKNPYKSESFNQLAQLDAVVKTIEINQMTRVIVFGGSSKFNRALSVYCRRQKIGWQNHKADAARKKGWKRLFREFSGAFFLKHLLHLFVFSSIFLLRSLKIKNILHRSQRKAATPGDLLIMTCYPSLDLTAAEAGMYRNKFFSSIQESLENQRQNVTWLAQYVPNNTTSFPKAFDYVKRFITDGHRIFFLEEAHSWRLHLRTILKLIGFGLKFRRLEKQIEKLHAWKGYGFYPLLRDDWYSSFAGTTGYLGMIYYALFQNHLKNIVTRQCLYLAELHAWEKALLLARDAVCPQMKCLGYQSGTVSRMTFNYFNDPREIHDQNRFPFPKPEIILCNGRLPYRYFRESGWKDEELKIVEATRYCYLKKYLNEGVPGKRSVVLIACSISPEESSSIGKFVYEAYRDDPQTEIWLKPHPFLPIEKLIEAMGVTQNGIPFKIKYDPIEELLREAKVVVVGESGVSIEALALGCEVMIVNGAEWINMSPLKDVRSSIVHTVNTPDELKSKISAILGKPYNAIYHKVEAVKIIDEFFYLNSATDEPRIFLEVMGVASSQKYQPEPEHAKAGL